MVTSRDYNEMVFPWRPPAAEHRVDGPLTIVGCAGEFEPVTFTVHPQAKLEDVSLAVEGLDGWRVECFHVRPLRRKTLGEAAFINDLPGLPEAWKNVSPELLVPLAREAPTLQGGLGHRFYVDCRIPDGQEPGRYRATATLRSRRQVVVELPLVVRVLPFRLAAAPSTYWMWRLTWSPIDRPENLACLRDIAEHGYTGLARKCGARFEVAFDPNGAIRVRPGTMPAFARALRHSGLAPRFADDAVAGRILRAVAKHLDLPVEKVSEELPDLEEAVYRQLRKSATVAEVADEELRRRAAARAAALQAKVRPMAVEAFRQVKALADELGVDLRVFPVDEPCGTPWQRRWTAYVCGLAHAAGLRTWSTRNNWDWDAGLDEGAAGAMINGMYREPSVVEASYQGELAVSPLPWVGAFRDGAKYHFRGMIDDVRIYDRALPGEQMRPQHERPAPEPIVHLPCDAPDGRARLVGRPTFVPGRIGRAVRLNGADQHVEPAAPDRPIDLSRGWAISLWYKGRGCLFGRGYGFYHERGRVRYKTDREHTWFRFGGHESERFWCHLTVSFDPAAGKVRAFCHDAALRRWHRRNIRWNYVQVRSAPPRNSRFKTGIMSWWYAAHGALKNVTTFCYDWNATHLYVVYPKNGHRFENDGVWYRTLGWEACREGIDDARYLQTLVEALEAKRGLSRTQAVGAVEKLLAPVDGSYASIHRVRKAFGTYGALRKRIIEEVLALR
ncbi:MAG: hypothetical protein ACLF0G_02195 [Candidatus Brocadiia bacterium]